MLAAKRNFRTTLLLVSIALLVIILVHVSVLDPEIRAKIEEAKMLDSGDTLGTVRLTATGEIIDPDSPPIDGEMLAPLFPQRASPTPTLPPRDTPAAKPAAKPTTQPAAVPTKDGTRASPAVAVEADEADVGNAAKEEADNAGEAYTPELLDGARRAVEQLLSDTDRGQATVQHEILGLGHAAPHSNGGASLSRAQIHEAQVLAQQLAFTYNSATDAAAELRAFFTRIHDKSQAAADRRQAKAARRLQLEQRPSPDVTKVEAGAYQSSRPQQGLDAGEWYYVPEDVDRDFE